ncbi:MAG TPA: formate dehydrogenase accessory sulfurtransferase FdhD [Rhodanobacteraceae bacterium]|nr:formate dehydrogenase accessory sulfurtransferase FdhD [Rhodanobacteraceae bacterium]
MNPQRPAEGLHIVSALRIESGQRQEAPDRVIEETPVAMLYNGIAHAVMMATPCDLEDFALGFALTEGIIENAAEFELVDCLRTEHGISLQALIPQIRLDELSHRKRNLAGRSGCGLCGVESLEQAVRPLRSIESDTCVAIAMVNRGLQQLAEQQPLNRCSGGVHAAGYVYAGGILAREDVGRHNALDKLIGALARPDSTEGVSRDASSAWRAGSGLLAITSRASYEIVHKAASAGIAVIAAISAPTSLAIKLADQAGVTLIGFARAQTMNVYTHPRRLLLQEQ